MTDPKKALLDLMRFSVDPHEHKIVVAKWQYDQLVEMGFDMSQFLLVERITHQEMDHD